MRRTLTLLFLMVAALTAVMGSATASPAPNPSGPGRVVVTEPGFAPQDLVCPSSNVCVWPVTDGSRNRCTWVNKDDDWQNTPVVCSWSSSSPVKAIYNKGASSNSGVCLYAEAGFHNWQVYLAQGAWITNTGGWFLRSHRWVTSPDVCFST